MWPYSNKYYIPLPLWLSNGGSRLSVIQTPKKGQFEINSKAHNGSWQKQFY